MCHSRVFKVKSFPRTANKGRGQDVKTSWFQCDSTGGYKQENASWSA
jgi:hypothetical protein